MSKRPTPSNPYVLAPKQQRQNETRTLQKRPHHATLHRASSSSSSLPHEPTLPVKPTTARELLRLASTFEEPCVVNAIPSVVAEVLKRRHVCSVSGQAGCGKSNLLISSSVHQLLNKYLSSSAPGCPSVVYVTLWMEDSNGVPKRLKDIALGVMDKAVDDLGLDEIVRRYNRNPSTSSKITSLDKAEVVEEIVSEAVLKKFMVKKLENTEEFEAALEINGDGVGQGNENRNRNGMTETLQEVSCQYFF